MTDTIEALIVDDDAGIRFFLTETLEQMGYNVTTAIRGGAALDILRDTAFDLIFLDLNLGSEPDGLRILEMVKWRWEKTAVIILTAHGTMDSALTAIREGVEGYLLKPVTPAEVRDAAQKALSRQQVAGNGNQPKGERDPILVYKNICLDVEKHIASVNENSIELTASEFDLLAYFIQNQQRVIAPKELVRAVRNYDCEDEKEAREIIKWYIHRLRKKIENDPSEPAYLINVRGVGYRLG